MSDTLGVHLPHTDGTVVEYCQSLPGALLAAGHKEAARVVMLALADLAEAGYLPRRAQDKSVPDIQATLWFIQTGFTYYSHTRDDAAWETHLLPRMKRIGQNLIGDGIAGTRMGDGGLLELGTDAPAGESLVVNILWDSTLAILAEELHRAGDAAGDHFERLGGRFKRSFLKTFWSEREGALRTPGEIAAALPEPRQLLATVLPASSIPRTKLRQMVDFVRQRGLTPLGVRVGPREFSSPDAEAVCPCYLIWLAEGHVRTSDTPANAVAEAMELLRPLSEQMNRQGALSRYYGSKGEAMAPTPHGPTTAEMQRVWRALREASEKPIGNSKRTRITGLLMPGGDA